MAIQIDTSDYIENNGASEFRSIIKNNQIKKWFFIINLGSTFATTGTFYEACKSVKSFFRNNQNTNYGVIKLIKIEDK